MSNRPVSKAMQLCLDKLRAGRTRAWIAAEVGYGAAHIRRYMLGHYEGQACKKLEEAIVARFDHRICPHDGQEKQPTQCQRIALRGRPHGFPDAENLWLACQACPHKPIKEGSAK
jgi:hypothetical protein